MLQVCEDCTCRFSAGAPLCPQCGSTSFHIDGEDTPAPKAKGKPGAKSASGDNE